MGKQNAARPSSNKDRARDERLARALRENLRRRKAQTRGRDEETGAESPAARVPSGEDSKQP
jgi:hypothetical protein